MTDVRYSLDLYLHRAHKMLIIVRRQQPYTDAQGVYHKGSQSGISVWFTKMRYARSGKEQAAISANTATSHALYFTKQNEWEQHIGVNTDLSRDRVNEVRKQVGKEYTKHGWVFVGNPDHKIGERLGVTKLKGNQKKLVKDYTAKKIDEKICKMLEFTPEAYQLDEKERNVLVNRCIRKNVDDPIITVSDLFDAVCLTVEEKAEG